MSLQDFNISSLCKLLVCLILNRLLRYCYGLKLIFFPLNLDVATEKSLWGVVKKVL